MGVLSKIKEGLYKTRQKLAKNLSYIFTRNELDDDFFNELEEVLITSDISVDTVEYILSEMRLRARQQKIKLAKDAKSILRTIIKEILTFEKHEWEFPLVLTIVGVNGVGKTTTIGKLAKNFSSSKKSVLLVAGDTFRAAASAQLEEWAKRTGVRIVKQSEGADPSAVVFDAIASAKAKNNDVVIIDTAGRLHNKVNLMEELKKINKVSNREWQDATHKNILVIDATTGQNAINQIKAFNEVISIDGIILTKLDGSAKGGIILSIALDMKLPIIMVGVGEGVDDLVPFNADEFVEAIFD